MTATRPQDTPRPAPRYNVRERIADNGLTFSVSEYTGDDDDHFLATERCEAFVAEVTRDICLIDSRTVSVRRGSLVVLWRVEVIEGRGYGRGQTTGDVRYNGYGNHGRQSVGFNSDAEAALHVRALRDVTGKVVKADGCDAVKGWGDAYSRMMSY